MIKKKGSIVPKYLIESHEKKAQHLLKFGCDVSIEGYKVKVLTDGVIFVIPNDKYCNLKKKKGTQKRRVRGYHLKDGVKIEGYRGHNTVLYIEAPCEDFILSDSAVLELTV